MNETNMSVKYFFYFHCLQRYQPRPQGSKATSKAREKRPGEVATLLFHGDNIQHIGRYRLNQGCDIQLTPTRFTFIGA